MGSIDELRPLEEGDTIKAYYRVVLKSKFESLFKINAVANIKMSLHEKVSQVTLFQFLVQNSLAWDCNRFKILKHGNNEVSINLVVPIEEAVLVWIVHVWHLKCSSEFLHKWSEQEVLVHGLLN